ncbi:MAG: hypothetical protein M3329_01205 [Pseudomonadota bacterium]|nr:hypothetical protein [Pseudomonadota bacterium]
MQQTAVKIDNPVIRSIDREDVQITPVPRVRFRPVMPAEKAGLAAGFEQLSDASRYRRFLAPKKCAESG